MIILASIIILYNVARTKAPDLLILTKMILSREERTKGDDLEI
jgi:hypothetical protein